ncbi:MAG: hypothetical protein RXN88_02710 [Acidilobus sp.]
MERLARKAVRDMIIITFLIAVAGGALVALSPRTGKSLLFVGVAIMLAAPWISYLLILWTYKEKVMKA